MDWYFIGYFVMIGSILLFAIALFWLLIDAERDNPSHLLPNKKSIGKSKKKNK